LTKISFGILLADYASNPIDLCSVSVTSLAALVNVYRVRRHYVLLDLTGDGVVTVGSAVQIRTRLPDPFQ
jgi:hypothetical protein